MKKHFLFLIMVNLRKCRKFMFFVKYFFSILSWCATIELPCLFETLVLNYPNIGHKLGFTHEITFFKKKKLFFLQLSELPYGSSLIFLIDKFGKTHTITRNLRLLPISTFLLFNNFYFEHTQTFLITKLIRQIFSVDVCLLDCDFFYKLHNSILFDFDSKKNVLELRCYEIRGTLFSIPRYLRKFKKTLTSKNLNYNILKKKIIYPKIVIESFTSNKKRISLIKITETGWRLTLKIVNFLSILKK